MTTLPEHPRTDEPAATHSRRRFLTYLVAAPTLAVAAQVVTDVAGPATAQALPSLPAPAELLDLGDALILAGKPTEDLIVVTVDERGRVGLALPRAEVGQGITTAVAMLLADELDVPLDRVDVTLADARPELVFNQLTGGSNTMRSVYGPVRRAAAVARARLLAAAALRWGTTPGSLTVTDGVVSGPGGRTATYGELSAAAADRTLAVAPASPKPASAQRVVGTPTSRTDARAMVTGRQRYTLDLDVVPGALPTMLRRPPTINGTVRSLDNEAEVRAMPGVVDVAVVPTGVAVLAETFGQARDAVAAVRATWGPGTVDGEDDESIRRKLRAVTPPPLAPGLLVRTVDAEFDFAFVSHAPLEPNCAIAHVTADRAEIWSPLKSPIVAQETIAAELGLPVSRVTVHVVQGGGSFGRRLFSDAALEAARVSKATGRPVKLLWSRIDDMRHGRARAASHHRIRATHAAGDVLTFEHRVASVETDFGHGLGEILTSVAASLPVGGNASFAQTVFLTTVHSPYHFGVTTQTLAEVPLQMHTGSWRSVYSANTRGAEEVVVDELAAATGRDPAEFRRRFLKEDRYRAVLDKVVQEGQWGRRLPRGRAQGLGFHAEYRGCTACLVEIDAHDPQRPRVTRATIAVDVGKAVNPRGLEAQMLGGLTDAIGTTLRAGLHVVDGLPLEGSYSQFHYTRQADSPADVRVFVIDSSDEPGGAGELGVPAAVGAVANAYARATGTRPRSFPLVFPVDFEPFPR
ncbi:molybdopterin cofactor-binding domain-containing protein [Geodermatophilus sp. SYSU D01036]